MKPLGPIPDGYHAIGGQLAIGAQSARDLVDAAGGTPLFVYSRAHIDRRVAALRAAMPGQLAIHYAIKANPFPPLLAHMATLVDGFDIASGGELAIVRDAGVDLADVSFAGPGKRDRELEAAVLSGITLNCESENEAQRALAIGDRVGRAPRIAVRVNPDFELKGSGMKMGGGARQFGVDAERVPALAKAIIAGGADWQGLHIFAGSQNLDAEAIAETQGKVLDLADSLARAIGAGPLPKLNIGGGLGIPYFAGDVPVDIGIVGDRLGERFADLPDSLAQTTMAMELGRYLVGEAGVYLCEVIDRKISHGEVFLITDGGLHHQLAASGNFGTVVRRNYPVAVANRFDAEPVETANVVGCLCTPLDRLADKAFLPAARIGDLIAVFCAGAYGATASPMMFLGQGAAREILV
ncbi:pyridoxal-dependent decarboxylase, exosortase A system-associated [Altererythrobacter aerius]|uniref:Pyridoxal-dependent decarboxylase, exosortase A system-associated n=1 Tax=Tsuneonella aeria TaxID=1837929 RepID=A0A6I4TDD0_9SPHN|nr:pyridoxal-dependent decarboxylase, exosortase A system-associated [Tsuneonella aeria]